MKNIKIGVTLVVVSLIIAFSIRSFIFPPPPPQQQTAQNQYILKVEKEIELLNQKPVNKFCKDHYDLINYYIKDYHKNKKLSSTTSENDRLKDDLSKQLFAAYANKFISQAFHIFNLSEWKPDDLKLIRNEVDRLIKSTYLSRPSPVYSSFSEIQIILNKYDEISNFVSFCKGYSPPESGGLKDMFPVSVAEYNISKANAYLSSNMGNQYVNKCIQLRQGLKEVPYYFFKEHIAYLDKKISSWSGMYVNFQSQKAYRDGLYLPLKAEIDGLDNNLYKAQNYDQEYQRLLSRWQEDSRKAFDHFLK